MTDIIEQHNTEDLFSFFEACYSGDLKKLATILKSHPNFVFSTDSDVNGLMMACQSGHIDIVKYLLTSPELTVHADIAHLSNFDTCLHYACMKGHIDIVKYLTSSLELKEHAIMDNDALCCAENYLDVVQFLLTDPLLKEHADPYAHSVYGCNFFCYLLNELNNITNHNHPKYKMLEYLFYDYGLKVSQEDRTLITNKVILDMLDYQERKQISEQIYHALDESLDSKTINKTINQKTIIKNHKL